MMEIKEAKKIVIAKPVASRPALSSFKSFSELLPGTIDSPGSNAFSETVVAAIRPRTVRFMPVAKRDLSAVATSAELSGSAACYPYDKNLNSDTRVSNVIYKPIARFLSKKDYSLLENLGNSSVSPGQGIAEVDVHIQPSNQIEHQTNFSSDRMPNGTMGSCENDKTSLLFTNNRDRPSYDGQNWRKYGQKQVKGSEYPRSYYKCTQPNCPVKKKVERMVDDKNAEVVYKGEHNHSKPQILNQKLEGRQSSVENLNVVPINNPVGLNCSVSTSTNSLGVSGECKVIIEALEEEEEEEKEEEDGDELKSKRRKQQKQLTETGTSGQHMPEPEPEPELEPRIVVQNSTDSETTGDGFRWRKYGQKVVKGNPYPRSYYKCTNPKCNVRKYVERMSENPGTFLTTYEGRHCHDMPTKLQRN